MKKFTINLPNGFLQERQSNGILAAVSDNILLPVTFLDGEIFCMLCFSHFNCWILVRQPPLPECNSDATKITCPDCNAPVIELGTDTARVMLTRKAKTKIVESKIRKRTICPPKNIKKKKK